jgi:multicomponent Na+:H+ antiporter subunit E
MRKRVVAFILHYGFWLLLTLSLEPRSLVLGAVLTLLVVVLTWGKHPQREWLLNPARLAWVALYIPYFTYACIRANLDLAYRVVHPDLPIRPGIVKVTTSLKTNLAKTFLANSITLLPGTHVVDVLGGDIYVHWINVTTDDPQKQAAIILQHFEPLVKRIFE